MGIATEYEETTIWPTYEEYDLICPDIPGTQYGRPNMYRASCIAKQQVGGCCHRIKCETGQSLTGRVYVPVVKERKIKYQPVEHRCHICGTIAIPASHWSGAKDNRPRCHTHNEEYRAMRAEEKKLYNASQQYRRRKEAENKTELEAKKLYKENNGKLSMRMCRQHVKKQTKGE